MAGSKVNRPQPRMKNRPGVMPKSTGLYDTGASERYAHERELEAIRLRNALEVEDRRSRNARDLYVLQHGASDTTVVGGFSAEAKGGRFRMRGGMKSKHVRAPGAWGTGIGGPVGSDAASFDVSPGGGVRVTDDWWAPRDTWATRDKDGNVVAPEYTGLDLGDMNFPRGNGRFQGGVLDRTFIARMTQQLMGGISPDDPNYGRAYDRARAAAREMHNQGLANFQSWARGQRELRDRTAREERMRTREERALEASKSQVQQPETVPAFQKQDLPPGYSAQPATPPLPADDGQSADLHAFDRLQDGTQAASKGGNSVLSGPALSYFDGGDGKYTGKPSKVETPEPAPETPLPDNIADYSDKDIERASGALVKGTAGKWTTPPSALPSSVPAQRPTWQQARSGASGTFETTGSSGVRSIKRVDRKTGRVSYDVRGTLNETYRPGDDNLAKRTVADWEARGVGGAGLKSAQANTLRQARDRALIERDVQTLNAELATETPRTLPLKPIDRNLKEPRAAQPSLADRLRALPVPARADAGGRRSTRVEPAPMKVEVPTPPPLDAGLDAALGKELEASRRALLPAMRSRAEAPGAAGRLATLAAQFATPSVRRQDDAKPREKWAPDYARERERRRANARHILDVRANPLRFSPRGLR